jgi:hypothetical protein
MTTIIAMGRRNALAIAAAISATGMSAALAIGANFGLFGLAVAQNAAIGNFQAVTASAVTTTADADTVHSTDDTIAPATSATEPAPEIVSENESPAPTAGRANSTASNGASADGLAQAASVAPPQANVPEQTPVACSNSGHGNCESRGTEVRRDDDHRHDDAAEEHQDDD